ncbi:hypothetical protein C439_14509 [Haloferax mediterranei ATCC 33500]|uniref:Uncharacterized protein n=1 Tax=Haloferax mediterranei (strain ATCC 33500 / DSM 1411 / JCM 8866 / NBRC 14739 / NCIMB 2177 / R-4) TaxID=523841 RepID=M0IUD9_HALMT|nr:hypothetical protein BM92_13520 [Haloferax mediterranei ATCC 33500]ELZ99079.1 hypothetical protein C439_14509 [Haloferax mediterranei ATCC 33500]
MAYSAGGTNDVRIGVPTGDCVFAAVKLDSGLRESYGVSIADGQDPAFVSVGLFADEIDVNTVWT